MQSTLSTDYQDLQSDLGYYLGFGRGLLGNDEEWTDDQLQTITMCLKTGLRQFYTCGYDWSFLKPVASVTLASGESTVALPDDYGSADGQAVVGVSGGTLLRALAFGPMQPIYQKNAQSPTTTGPPQHLCEEPLKGTTARHGQRLQLRVWPIADQDYTLTFPYRINPDFLSGNLPYAYGGSQHAQTLLQSCKYAAERDVDDIAGGPQSIDFAKALEASKMMDRRNKPQTLGQNRDNSDWRARQSDQRVFPPIIIQGSIPT